MCQGFTSAETNLHPFSYCPGMPKLTKRSRPVVKQLFLPQTTPSMAGKNLMVKKEKSNDLAPDAKEAAAEVVFCIDLAARAETADQLHARCR